MPFLTRSRELLVRGWAKIRGREVKAEQYADSDWVRRYKLRHPLSPDGDDLAQRYARAVFNRLASGDLVSEADVRAAALTLYGGVAQKPLMLDYIVATTMARGRARRLGYVTDDWDEGESGTLPDEEAQLVAGEAATTINRTLARLFLRLGPPPEGTSGDYLPVSSGGGGAQE
ncbi:hypothetical protein HEP87_42940 [Streptomyces sp. S1D4-11]|nr:hypothetical protein [Streptomyces sp. S1D4-11]QIY99440.1 hypothetical protein HEP87_42940 [Streptomyces sp. S1D4-11]